jgi:ubiquinone biosynthesis protein
LEQEAPQWAQLLPDLPRLIHQKLTEPPPRAELDPRLMEHLRQLTRSNRRLYTLMGILSAGVIIMGVVIAYLIFALWHFFNVVGEGL